MEKFLCIVLFYSFGNVIKTSGAFGREDQRKSFCSCSCEDERRSTTDITEYYVEFKPSNELNVRRQALKTTFLSWFTGSCKVSYERAIFSRQTMEFTAGYIGFGHDKFNNNPTGFTARYAHKFILYGNHIRPLNGFYLRPEVIFSHFHYDTNFFERELSKMGDAVFTVGYQHAIHRFVADVFFGGGYAFGKEADTHYEHGFMLWNFFKRYHKHIGMTFGIKFGVSF